MNILISTFGVRGAVQPYLALAIGLQAALGEKIRAEDSVTRTIDVIERTQRRSAGARKQTADVFWRFGTLFVTFLGRFVGRLNLS